MLPKGSAIGILGGGQLGQMMAEAAHQLGYRVLIFDCSQQAPAFCVADEAIVGDFHDLRALESFAKKVDLITIEFENIPLETLLFLEKKRPLFPSATAVKYCQDRLLEKRFLHTQGFPVVPFYEINSEISLSLALKEIGFPSILKTAKLGYDGKGQIALNNEGDVPGLWERIEGIRSILEKKISFHKEASVIIARSYHGETLLCSIQENYHKRGILDYSLFPPHLESSLLLKMENMGKKIADALKIVGLLTVEFFVLPDGSLLINELAPRPHNSGHHTLESLSISQFEQAIRAITGEALLSPKKHSAAVMINLLGDLWKNGEPRWEQLGSDPDLHLHLYGKKEAKPGRKMGHLTLIGREVSSLLTKAKEKVTALSSF